jgi:hypothetical protein
MKKIGAILGVLLVAAMLLYFGIPKFISSLNRGLEEEKSYTRHAMEYHREHPEMRRGDSVLDTWSDADYIAETVFRNGAKGDWVSGSDKLGYVPANLKRDRDGVPFCILRRTQTVVVVKFIGNTPTSCTTEFTSKVEVTGIASGELQFSGRTDYWVYLLQR